MTPQQSKKILMVIVLATWAILAGVWAMNGYQDTWLYVTAGIIALPAPWFVTGKKDKGQQ